MNLVAVPSRTSAKAHTIAGDAKRVAAALTHSTTLAQALATKQTITRMLYNLRELQVMNRAVVQAAREQERVNSKRVKADEMEIPS